MDQTGYARGAESTGKLEPAVKVEGVFMAGYILKVTMEDTHPPVWRRLLIPDRILFSDLHSILQMAFGWEDEHLHDFSFPQERLRIVQSADDVGWGYESVPENEVLVDDYLQDYKWIRYTYDFGDDWKHKIVFEKTDLGYESRFAKVLKYRGDNFTEDSGGIYGEYFAQERDEENELLDYRTSFDLNRTNEILQNMTFPVRRRKKRTESAKRNKQVKEISKLVDELLKEVQKGPSGSSIRKLYQEGTDAVSDLTLKDASSSRSGIDKDQSAWVEFWYAKRAESAEPSVKLAPKKKKDQYEQLTLPFVKMEKTESVNYSVFLTNPVVPVSVQLTKFPAEYLEDYCRYLQVEIDPKSKRKNAETYIRTVTENPDYLFMIFTREELETLWKIHTNPPGRIDPEPENLEETVCKALLTGIMTSNIRRKKRERFAEISFTLEGDEITTAMRKYAYKKKYREILRLEDELQRTLAFYGCIEIDEWGRITRKLSLNHLTEEAFRRYVYWHLTFNVHIRTATNVETGSTFAFMPQLDPDNIYPTVEKYAKDLPWRELARTEYDLWCKGLDAFYDCWGKLFEIVVKKIYDQEYIEYYIDSLITEVLNGGTVDEICQKHFTEFPAESLTDSLILWKPVYDVVHKTALPGLKAYSREEYKNITGKEGPAAFATALTKKRNIRQTTHLYMMEPDVQRTISSLTESWNPENAAAFETLIDECGGNNEEMLHLLGSMYAGSGQFEKALRIYERLKKLHKGYKEDILNSIELIRDMSDETNTSTQWKMSDLPGDEEKTVPFRRESKKIMPNDPCPCGSGRKYKHCCGKYRK